MSGLVLPGATGKAEPMEFKLADIGEGMAEAEILRWLVAEGDRVTEDQPLVEVQTDKTTAELPSPWSGTVERILIREGSVVPVGVTLVEIRAVDGSPPAVAAVPAPVTAPDGAGRRRVLASPATRRRAREFGIDLRQVPARGPGGRVTHEDLAAFVAEAAPAPARSAPAPQDVAPMPARGAVAPAAVAGDERVPLQGLRRVIARNMAESHRAIPAALHLDDCDVTELAHLRGRWNALLVAEARQSTDAHGSGPGDGPRLTFLPAILKAVAAALRHHPRLNAHFDEERQEIVVKRALNIGLATDTPEGLIVPVVHDADAKTLRQLAADLRRLAAAARGRTLRQAETEGGTFTITNHGSVGGLYGHPIIRRPEVAILGLGRIRPEAVVRDDQVVVRTILHFSVAFDHRVLDGADVARFANLLKHFLERPEALMLEMA